MKLVIIVGTRPEIIKMAPVIRAGLTHGEIETEVWHTGQHYSFEMDKQIFEDLELPTPAHNLTAGSGSHAVQTGKIMVGLEALMISEKPDAVLVQGDTNTVLAATLAAAKLHIPVGHVEAGLRSYDRAMPEEINRIIADHTADVLYAPTKQSRAILEREGIIPSTISVTGNTVVDAALQSISLARKKSQILKKLSGAPFVLVTLHRAENVDRPQKLGGIVEALKKFLETNPGTGLVWPMHPRTRKQLELFGLLSELAALPRLNIMPPAGYLDTLLLQSKARAVMTDSGGIQEEACILGVPCITLRENTERPESVEVGANELAGTSPQRILASLTRHAANNSPVWQNPFGDGTAGELIITDIFRRFGNVTTEAQYGHSTVLAR